MMQSFYGIAAALSTLTSTSLALKLRLGQLSQTPGAHLWNLAGEGFDVNQPGTYVLFQIPQNTSQPALVRVRGDFHAPEHAPCALYLTTVTISGEWLGNQTVHVGSWSTSLAIKVSSSSPAFAGSWRNIANFTVPVQGREVLPETIQVMKAVDSPTIKFHVGPKQVQERPTITIAEGIHEGLDVSFNMIKWFDVTEFAGLLGTGAHDHRVEALTQECEANIEYARYQPGGSHLFASWSVQPLHLWNLAGEGYDMNQPGDYVVMRVPKEPTLPTLIQVRGTFLPAETTPCVLYLESISLSGEWLGMKTVHVSSLNRSFSMKVSWSDPSDPGYAGHWRTADDFPLPITGADSLPETISVSTGGDGATFKFHVGPKEVPERPIIAVTQAAHGGLDVALTRMKKMDVPEIGGLLGTDKHNKAFDRRSSECEVATQRFPDRAGGSLLTAAWGFLQPSP